MRRANIAPSETLPLRGDQTQGSDGGIRQPTKTDPGKAVECEIPDQPD